MIRVRGEREERGERRVREESEGGEGRERRGHAEEEDEDVKRGLAREHGQIAEGKGRGVGPVI